MVQILQIVDWFIQSQYKLEIFDELYTPCTEQDLHKDVHKYVKVTVVVQISQSSQCSISLEAIENPGGTAEQL